MSEFGLSRERVAWTAAVVALATSASWLAAILLALLARQSGLAAPEWLVAGRALVRAGWLLIREATPAALLVLFVTGLIALFAWLLRQGLQANGGTRHA